MQKQDKSAPIVDAVTVTPGWEAALGAALGDDLEAPGLAATAADTATGSEPWRSTWTETAASDRPTPKQLLRYPRRRPPPAP